MAQPMPYRQENRAAVLTQLREEVMHRGCPAGGIPVFGEGSPVAQLMLIGESPRAAEERAGKPLTGSGRRFLADELYRVGVHLFSVWLTDAVKCRTVRQRGERVYERPPNLEEITGWAPVLLKELEILRPSVVVCLGATAGVALLGVRGPIRDLRGRWFDGPFGSRVVVTYHPSYLLCKRGSSKEIEKAQFRLDVREAVSLLA